MIEGSVVTPEMRKMIGAVTVPEFPPAEVEKWAIDRYLEATEDDNPLWRDEGYARKSRWGGIIAPPTFVETFSPLARNWREGGKHHGPKDPFPYNFAAGEDFECFLPLRVGDRISARSILSDITEKNSSSGSRMVLFRNDNEYRNQTGQLVARNSHITLCIEKQTHREAAPVPDAVGRPVPPATKRDEQVCFEDVQAGDDIPFYIRTFDVPALARWMYSMGLYAPMHYDYRHATVDRGLPDLIVQGPFTFFCFGRLVTDWIGGWGMLKKLSVQFRGTMPIRAPITFGGRVAQKDVRDGENFVELQFWAESQNGQKLHLGKATVTLPARAGLPS